MFTLPTNRSMSRTNTSSAADASRVLFASDVALFIVPATTVLFAPVTTGDGAGASVVIVGIIDATPNANANTPFVTASFSRFALCSARLAAAARRRRPSNSSSPRDANARRVRPKTRARSMRVPRRPPRLARGRGDARTTRSRVDARAVPLGRFREFAPVARA